MADFIVDEEEVDENGAPMRYFNFFYSFFKLRINYLI